MKILPDTLYYYLSFFLMHILGLLQTKILTTILLPKVFGEIQVLLPFLAWAVLIGGMGTPQFVVRFFSRDKMKAYQEGLFVSIGAILIIGLIVVPFFLCSDLNYKGLEISARMASIFVLAVIAQHVVALVKALLRVQERHIFYNAASIFTKIFLVTGIIVGVVWWHTSPIEGYLLGSVLASAVTLFILMAFFRMPYLLKAKAPSSRVNVGQLISYGFPIVFIMLMGDMLPNLNRFVIFAKLDSSSVAKYAVGCMIASLCFQALYEPINTFFHAPAFRAWEKGNKEETREIITKYLNVYIIVGLTVCGLTIRFEDILINLVANVNYRLPAGCFALLILSNFILGIYRFVSIHYYLRRNTSELGLIFFLSIVVNFSISLMIIEETELLGAVLAVLFSSAVLAGAVWFRGQKILAIKLFPKYYVPAIIISIVLIFVPSFSVWNLYSPLRWLDLSISFGIAASLSLYSCIVFRKHFRSITGSE